MQNEANTRSELLDAMAFVFLYSDDPGQLEPVEQSTFRDDIVRILRGVESEIAASQFEVQRNWFIHAKEKIEEGIVRFDCGDFRAASKLLGESEDIFRSGIDAHNRRTDFIAGPDGIIPK